MDRGTKITYINEVKNEISARKIGNVPYYTVQSNTFRVLAYLTTYCMVKIYIANGFGRKERLSGGKHFIIYLTLDKKKMQTTVKIILTLKSSPLCHVLEPHSLLACHSVNLFNIIFY